MKDEKKGEPPPHITSHTKKNHFGQSTWRQRFREKSHPWGRVYKHQRPEES